MAIFIPHKCSLAIWNSALFAIISVHTKVLLVQTLGIGIVNIVFIFICAPGMPVRLAAMLRSREPSGIEMQSFPRHISLDGDVGKPGAYCVYIVLSRSNTVLSRIIQLTKGDQYTHAALSLDENLEYMYSFGRRWAHNPFIGCFKHERLYSGANGSAAALPGVIIKIPVSAAQYKSIAGQLGAMLLDRRSYGYNYCGLVGNLAGISYENDTRFFCSEFVYYVLHKNGVCDLGLRRGLIRPQILAGIGGEIIFEGDLSKYERSPARGAEQTICGVSPDFALISRRA